MPVIKNPPQVITLDTYESIVSHDNIHDGLRYNMNLVDVIKSYPMLYAGVRDIIDQRYDSQRQRYVPYITSVIAGKEKYKADDFFFGFGSGTKSDQFYAWQEYFKKHIILNENLHEFWLL